MPVYNFLIRLYYLLLRLASPFNAKAKAYIKGRKLIYNEAFHAFCRINKPCIWFHCASMGEYEDAKHLIELCHQEQSFKIIVTFSSPSGFCYHINKHPFALISYLPFDAKNQMQRFIRQLHPSKLIISRNDIWPNMIMAAKEANVQLFLIDYNINERSFQLKMVSDFYKNLFAPFNTIFVQNQRSLQFMQKHLKLENIVLAGNTRLDALAQSDKINSECLNEFIDQKKIILFGSMLAGDQKILSGLNVDIFKTHKLIIVDHEPNIANVSFIEKCLGQKVILWSNLKTNNDLKTFKILYVDEIGLLKQLYHSSQIAYVGGGFNRIGIHNILEPAMAENYIAFGPNHRYYTEAIELLKTEETCCCSTAHDFNQFLGKYLHSHEKAKMNKAYVLKNVGASAICFNHIFETPKIHTAKEVQQV